MTNRPGKQPSLRDVAKRLGCSHSSLSESIHRGDLSRGFAIRDGRISVTDARALMEAWNGIPARKTAEAIVLHDVALDRRITAAQLFAERDAAVLLASALVRDGLADRSAQTFKTRISKRLREVAELHGAGAPEIARAWDELQSSIDLVKLLDEDEAAEEDAGDKAEP